MENRHVFDGNRWFQKEIDTRTRRAIRDRNAVFCHEHENDSDAELLRYLIDRIHALGYAPHPAEVIGARLIIERFSSWGQAIQAAGYRFPKGTSKLKNTHLYKDEQKNQIRIYRAERRIRLEKKAARKALREEMYISRKQSPDK